MGKRKKISFLSKNLVCIDDDDDVYGDDHHEKPIAESSKDTCVSINDVKKKMTENDTMIENKEPEKSLPCTSFSLVRCEGSNCVGNPGGNVSIKRSKMNDVTFNFHLESIWRSFPEFERASFTYLDSICFFSIRKGEPHAWELIKREDIFSKKYVFVPIVCWDHWRLVIFCHFGEAMSSNKGTRCILLLDSAEMGAKLIEPDLRKFVYHVFKAHGRKEGKNIINQIPLLVPKVPQQTNEIDCGRFVLYFIKLFMEFAPQNFCLSNGYPYFMKSDWFETPSFAEFCNKLDEESITLDQGKQVPRRHSQRIRTSTSFTRKPSRHVEVLVVDDSETSSEEVTVIDVERV